MLIDRASLRRLRRARELLELDEEAPRPLATIARDVGISQYHFIRQFDALFGETPHQYRTRARLDRAKQLLAAGASVTEACMTVGFSSVGSFSQLFARRIGVVPSAYRRLLVQVRTSFVYRGCLSMMYALPAGAFRNFQEARSGQARQGVPA
ncbi:MAG: helix-turn-helix transcriptional regulator [Kofleriaceae bacterium]|nr:helix-turn-helix transcriptional regulator [Kofleriaceae bacterium]